MVSRSFCPCFLLEAHSEQLSPQEVLIYSKPKCTASSGYRKQLLETLEQGEIHF